MFLLMFLLKTITIADTIYFVDFTTVPVPALI